MRTGTVSYKLEDLKKGVIIPIGFVGENDFTRVIFDAEEIYKKFQSASVSMKVQPPKGGIYPATVTRDGNTVIWQVKEADVANRGGGELQLTFTDGDTKIKTYIARTDVKRSLAGNGPAPDPVQDWIDEAEDVLDDLDAMDTIAKNAQAGDIGKALSPKTVENGVVTEWQFVEPGAGTDDYADLDNKPSIAGVTLSGDKTLEDLGIAADEDLDNLADEVSDVKSGIDGQRKSEKNIINILGQSTVMNKQIPAGDQYVFIITLDLIANEPYCMNLKIKNAVEHKVYMGMSQEDGTIIGYTNSIEVGDTYIYKLFIPSSDYKNAHFAVKCADPFDIEYANVFAQERLTNQIGRLITGNDITLLTVNATNKKQISSNGEVTDSTDTSYYVSNDIEIKENHWYMVTGSAGYGSAYFAILDEDKNVMITERSPSGSGTARVNHMVYMPINSKYIRIAYINSVSGGHIALCNSVKEKITEAPEWWNKFLAISYSSIGVATINTLETFISAGHFGFPVCKGDVRPTYDNKLVMCHDGGFTFDGNGRITTYDSGNKTLIHSMTLAQCLEKEYAGQATATENNHYQKVTDIDHYLQVCKQYGMIAFITIREDYISDVCNEVIAALKRNNMIDRAIINSYTPYALSYIRMLDDNLPLSFVQSDNYNLGAGRVGAVAGYGKAAITLVSTPANMRTYLTGLASVIASANGKGVGIMYAQPTTYEDVLWLINHGIMGAQIGRPCLPYRFEQIKFKVDVSSGVATLSEWFGMTTMEADVLQSGNVISISEFKVAGTDREFSDLIMEYWMNRFPYRITAISENGNAVTATWQNNALKITVADISDNDTIDVIVEV